MLSMLKAALCEVLHRRHHKRVHRYLPFDTVQDCYRCDKCQRFVVVRTMSSKLLRKENHGA